MTQIMKQALEKSAESRRIAKSILMQLRRSGPQTAGQIAEATSYSAGTTARWLSMMQKSSGWVQKHGLTSKRSAIWEITTAGRQAIEIFLS